MTNDRLKFRAWVEDVDLEDENGNEYKKSFMIYDIAVFGGYRVGHYGEDLERQLESQGFSGDEIEQFEDEWCLKEGDDWFNFVADEIEQSTGLKDKNGKLVFEGDVLSDYDGFKFLVRWNDLELKYMFIPVLKNNTEDLDIYPNECEIVGNIHQNPELIK